MFSIRSTKVETAAAAGVPPDPFRAVCDHRRLAGYEPDRPDVELQGSLRRVDDPDHDIVAPTLLRPTTFALPTLSPVRPNLFVGSVQVVVSSTVRVPVTIDVECVRGWPCFVNVSTTLFGARWQSVSALISLTVACKVLASCCG
jgi:hypothetical protein